MEYQGQSALIQSIIAGQKDVDEKVDSKEEVLKMLEQVGVLLEAKSGDDEGDAVRDFLMSAAEAVAKATREQGLIAGGGARPAEEKAMAALATALKATIEDKRRRHMATMCGSLETGRGAPGQGEGRGRGNRPEEGGRGEGKG